jgi:Flp pilus assembly protein TadG
MMRLLKSAARLKREERGTVAIIAAVSMLVLVGFLALAFDTGGMFVEQTRLQKAVDAAALAGARALDLRNLGSSGSTSCGVAPLSSYCAAQAYLIDNGVSANCAAGLAGCDMTQNLLTTVSNGLCATNGCYAWQVTAQHAVTFSFAQVLGFGQATVSATATAIASPASAVTNPLYYAVWGANPYSWPNDPYQLTTPSPQDFYCYDSSYSTWPGMPHCDANGGFAPGSFGPASTGGYIINDNNYQSNIFYGDPNKCWDPASGTNKKQYPECNPNYPASFTSNGFKGFFGPKSAGDFMSGSFVVGSSVQVFQGGIQNQDLCPTFANTPMVAPVIGNVTYNSGNSKYYFTIAAFRVVTTNCGKTGGQRIVVNIPLDQHIYQGTPGGTDINGPIIVELWQ